MDPFLLDLIVLRKGAYGVAEQRALSRDVERGLLLRVRRGVYVERGAFTALAPEGRHLVRMRALAAVSDRPPVFSHWSSAVALPLPILDRARLARLHVLLPFEQRRSVHGATVHLTESVTGQVVRLRGLLLTAAPRTVIDIAAASPFQEGVVTTDGALKAGVRRRALEELLETARPRRGATRVADVVGFAHPGGESANESLSRWTMLRLGVAPPELQHEFFDRRGFVARSDFYDRERRLAGEADGRVKLLDPAMAKQGAGVALWKEKKREDRLLGCVDRLARWGMEEAGSTTLLGPVLSAIGWLPARPHATLADYIAEARPFG